MIEDKRSQFKVFELKDPSKTRKIVGSMESVMRLDINSIFHADLDLDVLYELAYGYHNASEDWDRGYVVNCGVHHGGSLCVMGEAVRRNRSVLKPVIGIDPYLNTAIEGKEGSSKELWDIAYRTSRENIHHFGLEYFVCPVIFGAAAFFDVAKFRSRVILIDTSHIYEETKKEIEMLMPSLIDGGWVVFDDYFPRHSDVMIAVNEFIDTQQTWDLDLYSIQFSDMGYSPMILMQARKK